ncbi:hypothetical protein D3C75_912690 [compost metagenome]
MRGVHKLPVDRQLRIIPADTAFGRRGVVVGGFVEEFGVFAEHHETVGEPFWDP